jgi:hypothetical protein
MEQQRQQVRLQCASIVTPDAGTTVDVITTGGVDVTTGGVDVTTTADAGTTVEVTGGEDVITTAVADATDEAVE